LVFRGWLTNGGTGAVIYFHYLPLGMKSYHLLHKWRLSRISCVECFPIRQMISNYLVALARPLLQSLAIQDRDNPTPVLDQLLPL
jgi:hypothetical protein